MNSQAEIIKKFDGMPSLSTTVNQIIELFNKGGVDINILEKALLKDPNLSMQVLKIANSPFFGISGEVTSIKDACMIMGLTNVFSLVTAADVINSFSNETPHIISSVGFWEHSISTGIATTLILKKSGYDDADGFLVGLLHDIGKLALDYYQPELYENILSYQISNNCSYMNAEVAVANFTHAQLGAEIITSWKLNSKLAETILYHHDADNIIKSPALSALHIANFLIKGLDIGKIDNNQISEFYTRSMTKLDFKFKDMYEIMDSIEISTKNNSLLELVH